MPDLSKQLLEYVEANIERIDVDDVRASVSQQPARQSLSRPTLKPAWAFILGAATVLVLGGMAWLLRGDTSNPDVAASEVAPTPAAAFAFAESDLCEWVSEEEMTSFVREAYAAVGVDWDGTAAAAVPGGSAWAGDAPDCRWQPTGGGHVIARGLTPSHFDGPVVEYSEIADETWLPVDVISGHPDFTEGLIVANGAFGRFGFWVDGSEEALGLEMVLTAGVDSDDWERQQVMLLHIANSLLTELGWTPNHE